MINKLLTAIGKISLIAILAFICIYGGLIIFIGGYERDITKIAAGLFLLFLCVSLIT